MEKLLGKIQRVKFGIGGYQDSMLGIFFELKAGSYGMGDSRCNWDANLIECSDRTKWTEEDRSQSYDEVMRYVSDLLCTAKVYDINDLVGKPIEVTTDGMELVEWRILTEVL